MVCWATSYLFYEIFYELLFWIPFHGAVERIKKVKHARSNNRLLHWGAFGIRLRLFEVLVGIRLVPRAISQNCQ
jgi:hypothetical protein